MVIIFLILVLSIIAGMLWIAFAENSDDVRKLDYEPNIDMWLDSHIG